MKAAFIYFTVAAILFAGCSPMALYEGDSRPENEVATVETEGITIWAVDGKQLQKGAPIETSITHYITKG